jgi:hypothetical protein
MTPNHRHLSFKHYPSLRPASKTSVCWCGWRAETVISYITTTIDMVMSWCYAPLVKITEHPTERQMRQRLHYEAQRAKEIKERMEALAAAYNEFVDLRKEATERKVHMAILYGLIGDDVYTTNPDWVETGARAFVGGNDKEMRSQLPLWEAMKEYLQYVPEARIGEMEEFFSHIGYEEGNRQAIESALKRHPREFTVRKKKREKYLSLRK